MRPVTYSVNKHFIPVANKMLVEYPIMTLIKAGIKEIGITYNPGQLEYAKEVLGDGRKWELSFGIFCNLNLKDWLTLWK